jgi:hypothetical protein
MKKLNLRQEFNTHKKPKEQIKKENKVHVKKPFQEWVENKMIINHKMSFLIVSKLMFQIEEEWLLN